MMRAAVAVLVAALVVACDGCMAHAQVGYVNAVPVPDAGGVQLEVSDGIGDLREPATSLSPMFATIDLVGHATASSQRLGVGPSVMWAPLSGWDRDWTPTVRLALRPLQLELVRAALTGSGSGAVEVGLAWYPSQATRERMHYTVALSAEGFARYGAAVDPFALRFALLLGVGYGNSIGPTS
jgi:hypothetical protein